MKRYCTDAGAGWVRHHLDHFRTPTMADNGNIRTPANLCCCFGGSNGSLVINAGDEKAGGSFANKLLDCIARRGSIAAAIEMVNRILRQGSQLVLDSAQHSDESALNGSSSGPRLEQEQGINSTAPVLGCVVGESHTGRKTGAVVVNAEIERTVMWVDDRNHWNSRPGENVSNDRRDVLEQLKLDRNIDPCFRHFF